MKTIFLTVFEGNEARSILRTDILRTLQNEPAARIVLLMKSHERIEQYKKELNNDRIIFEVAPYFRSAGYGLDRFFARLKFLLLRTDTKKLQRWLTFQSGGNYSTYYFGSFLNFIFARPAIRRLVRWLDFSLIKSNIYAPLFDKYNPELVFLAHLFEEPEIHLLREAKKRGIKTVGFVNSWDKITGRCIMRLLPDKLIVFNDVVKEEAILHDDMKPENIFVSGIPHHDYYFNNEITPRNDFFKKIGADPEKKLIVYAPAGRAFSDSDWDIIDLLNRLITEDKLGNVQLLVRFQPNDILSEDEIKKRPWLVYNYPGMRYSSKVVRGIDWDMDQAGLQHLKDTLYHMSLVISYASSLAVDAAVFNKPIVNIGFELRTPRSALRAIKNFYGVAHYKNVIATNGVKITKNEKELISFINGYINNPDLDSQGRKRIVEEQCQFTDGGSGQRAGRFITEYLNH